MKTVPMTDDVKQILDLVYPALLKQRRIGMEIARARGVSPQAVRWADRRHDLRIKRDRGLASVLMAKMSQKESADFRFLMSREFTMKKALASIGRADLAGYLK